MKPEFIRTKYCSTRRLGRDVKVAVIFVMLLVCAVLLSSCASQKQVVWDESFIACLRPSEEIMQKLSGSVQDVDLKSSHDDVTVHVKQTLGDEKTLYIAMDVLFPDDIDLQTMTAEHSSRVQIIPKNIAFLEGKTEAADIKGLSWQEIHDKYKYDWLFFEMNSLSFFRIQKTSYDFANNTVSYLLLSNPLGHRQH